MNELVTTHRISEITKKDKWRGALTAAWRVLTVAHIDYYRL